MQAFLTAAFIFHLIVGSVTVWLGWRWVRRLRKVRPGWLWTLQLLADAILLQFAAVFTAVFVAISFRGTLIAPTFAIIRFLAQAFFGEGVLLAAWVTFVHLRAKPRIRALLPGLVAAALLVIYVDAYHIEPTHLQVRTHAIDLTRGKGAGETLRILHLSDLQTNEIGPYEKRVFEKVREINPDMIVFTGDYVQMRLEPQSEFFTVQRKLRDLLTQVDLRPPMGFFAVGGDVDGPHPQWTDTFKDLNVTTLNDDFAEVDLPGGKRVTIVGLSNGNSHAHHGQAQASPLPESPRNDLRFVIGHSPNFMRRVRSDSEVDLAMAGHTHGGQIVIPGVGPPMTLMNLPRKYAGGLNFWEGVPLHVSRGIGRERVSAPQLRFLCPPEICMLEVKY